MGVLELLITKVRRKCKVGFDFLHRSGVPLKSLPEDDSLKIYQDKEKSTGHHLQFTLEFTGGMVRGGSFTRVSSLLSFVSSEMTFVHVRSPRVQNRLRLSLGP